jgi:hypothetical protein
MAIHEAIHQRCFLQHIAHVANADAATSGSSVQKRNGVREIALERIDVIFWPPIIAPVLNGIT